MIDEAESGKIWGLPICNSVGRCVGGGGGGGGGADGKLCSVILTSHTHAIRCIVM